MKREELLKQAGDIVLVRYEGHGKDKNLDCFVIGWFYSLTEDAIHLKITSTRFESYESRMVPLDKIVSVDVVEMN